ncbi:MAG: hypothetical protein HQ546_04180, partial [Planctomycetes bacterium]|nr:hypothetical protein [Planctomycetota bacterium]
MKLFPLPRQMRVLPGQTAIGPVRFQPSLPRDALEASARRVIAAATDGDGEAPLCVRTSLQGESEWAEGLEEQQKAFIHSQGAQERYCLNISGEGVKIAAAATEGIASALATLQQMIEASTSQTVPWTIISDWPAMRFRAISPSLTWYTGPQDSYHLRAEGFDCHLWSGNEWKVLVDWMALHKLNKLILCMYGSWPFRLPDYPQATADYEVDRWDAVAGRRIRVRFRHPNIEKPFLPGVLDYARVRGIESYAYIGLNSFNGFLQQVESRGGEGH